MAAVIVASLVPYQPPGLADDEALMASAPGAAEAAATCCAVCVFAKAPSPGRVKTRLAATVGDDVACALARAFLEDTLDTIRQATTATIILALDGDPALLPALPDDVVIWSQGDGDLGARQERVLRRALQSHSRVLAIGTDAPTLPAEILRTAFAQLLEHDATLTPAADGGYCLLGVRCCPDGLLDDIPWSAADTAMHTVSRLQGLGLSVALTNPWYDIDTVDDLRRLQHELMAPGAGVAAHTLQVLTGMASP